MPAMHDDPDAGFPDAPDRFRFRDLSHSRRDIALARCLNGQDFSGTQGENVAPPPQILAMPRQGETDEVFDHLTVITRCAQVG